MSSDEWVLTGPELCGPTWQVSWQPGEKIGLGKRMARVQGVSAANQC